MATRDVITLNESASRLEVPQVGDSYNMPRDVNVNGQVTANTVKTGTQTPVAGEVAAKAVRFDDGTVLSTAAGNGTVPTNLATILPNGATGNIAAGQQFGINDSNGNRLFTIDEATGKVTQVNLDGMMGNIRDTLVEIPFKRANDEIRLSGTQTFTRASTGTYVDPLDGLVKTAAVDTPRFERMADGGVGILLEGSSTNYLLQSQDFTQTNWGKYGVTVTGNAVLGPDGATSADTITDDTTAAAYHRVAQLGSPIPAGDQTEYVIAKAGTLSHCVVMIHNATDGTVAYAVFDLANGAIISNSNGTAKIKPMANGYYWCEVNGTATAASNAYFHLHNGTSDIYTGTGTGTIHVWHAQAENLPFGSSVIPTTTAAVTRAADALSIQATGNTLPLYDKNCTVIVDFDAFGVTGDYRRVFDLTSSVNEQHTAYFNANGVMQYHKNPNAVAGSTIAADTVYRCAVRIQNRTIHGFLNGRIDGASTQQTIVGDRITNVYFGRYTTLQYLYGHIRNFRLYDRALTDSEIAAA